MVDPTLFSTVSDNSLLPFGQNLIAQGDDNSERFEITGVFENGFSFGNRIFNELFVSTNGGVSFIDQTINFAASFENTDYVIAPFLDDLDNRTLPPGADPGIYFDLNTDRDSVVVTWVGVGIFNRDITAPNTFQLEIMDLGNGDAELIYRFSDMGNARLNTFQLGAVADGGPRVFLRGGTAGDVLGVAADMDTRTGNTGVDGVWQFRVIDGQLQADDLLGDVLNGNNNPNTINGTDLNDILSGGGGNDTIFGRLGIDRISGDAGADSLLGEGDDDILRGGDDNDTLLGGTGDDSLFGDNGDDRLEGGAGTNVLDGGTGADALIGTGGTAFAAYGSSAAGLVVNLGSTGANTGDAAGDTYTDVRNVIGSEFDDEITGTADANILRGAGGNDAIDGADGNDSLFGEDGNDTLVGGDGDDELAGGAGADALIGGGGTDAASYRDSVTDVVADLQASAGNSGDAAGDSYTGIENLIGGSENDRLGGNSAANLLRGLDGDDTLTGRDGNDTLIGDNEDDLLNGGLGADVLVGGRGNDTATYADATGAVRADLSNSGTNTGEAAGDTYSEVENLVGSVFDDTLVGDAGDNLLEAGLGDNSLFGEDGNDTLRGGPGEDAFSGGAGEDTVDYSLAGAGVAASLTDSAANTGAARGDTYSGIENLIGTQFDDTLEDTAGANMVMGLGGNDRINLRGGADTVDGGDGTDTVSYQATGFVVVDLEDAGLNRGAATGATFTSVENLTGSNAADDLFGDGLANLLSGGGNVDRLDGRGGDDTLRGGAGNDILTGGDGADAIVMENGMGADVVTDFVVGVDTLDFSALTPAERAAVTVSADAGGNRVVTLGDGSSLTMTGVARNIAATGTVAVVGTATQNETLTADTATIADVDGLGAFAFQWTRGGIDIPGANGASLVLGQADVGQAIAVRVTFTDGFGSTETLTSAATAAVANVNDPATGAVVVTGTPREDATLTAETAAIADADGLGAFAFQWTRGGADIPGANGASLVLGQADVGQAIAVRVTFTDGFGATETLTSAATAPVANVNDLPTGTVQVMGTARVGQTLGSDIATLADEDGLGVPSLQWLRDGVVIPGQNGPDLLLTAADLGAAISLRVSYVDGQGTTEQVSSAATAPVVTNDLTLTGTPGNDRLEGAEGNDTITGAGGNDTLVGNDGNDAMNGGDGSDTLDGGAGNDFLVGGLSPVDLRDAIFGGDGNDTMNGGSGNDELSGGNGDDLVFGGLGSDTVIGNAGNDTLSGGGLSDLIFGGPGDDYINGGFGFDRLNGGTGADTFFHLGVFDHGSDWIQDYDAAGGDILAVGIAGATRSQFQVNIANTPNAGSAGVNEAFVIYRPTGQILFALVDGADDAAINMSAGGETFNLLG